MLRQPSPNRTGLLWAQVEWEVLLLRIEESQLLALVGVDDGENASNGFSQIMTVESLSSVQILSAMWPKWLHFREL